MHYPCPLRGQSRICLLAFACWVLIALWAIPVRAAEETQVPLDRTGHIGSVDHQLAWRLGLFLDRYPFLEEVRLFQVADSSFVFEIAQREAGRYTRVRFPLSAAGADSLRELVSSRAATLAPEVTRDQSGRPLLVGGYAALGLGFYAWAVPTLMNVHESQVYTGAYMLMAGASIMAPMFMTQGSDVSFPAADLALYGATRGIAHGALLHNAFLHDDDGHGTLGAALAGSLVEGVALGYWAQATHASGGVAGSIRTGGDFGLLYGLGIGDLTDRYDGKHRGTITALTVGGSALGMTGCYWLAKHRDYTYGDAGVMRMAGLVGGYLGLALAVTGEPDDSEPVTAAAMAGSALGLGAGDVFVRNTDLTGGQMVIVDLVTVAGGLLGLGCGLLASSDANDMGRGLLLASALGATAGYTAGVAGMRGRTRADAGPAATPGSGTPRRAGSWSIGLEPRGSRITRDHEPQRAATSLFLTLRGRFD
jgi:hypothetical protein